MTLQLGEIFKQKLSHIEGLQGKIFPIVADFGDNETEYPFLVYRRTSSDLTHHKDGIHENYTASYQLTIQTLSYGLGIEIADEVVNALSHTRGAGEGWTLTDCYITSTSEDFSQFGYIQNINVTLYLE